MKSQNLLEASFDIVQKTLLIAAVIVITTFDICIHHERYLERLKNNK